MPRKKIKIVLDADVIIHFFKGGKLSILPAIFPEYQYLVLDVVMREIPLPYHKELDRMINRDKTLIEETFGTTTKEIREFANLTSIGGLGLGIGESACMVYCLYHHDVLGSSNLKDVKDYCDNNGITYLTTIDFLYYAIKRKLLTPKEAKSFVDQVIALGSKLPQVDFNVYYCDKI